MVAALICAFKSSISGCTVAAFDGLTRDAALADSAVSFGMVVTSMPSAVAANRAAGSTKANTRKLVKMLAPPAPAVDGLVSPAIFWPSACSGAMSAWRYAARVAESVPRSLLAFTLLTAAFRSLTRSEIAAVAVA